jgi:long-chain fatty acid transport protein
MRQDLRSTSRVISLFVVCCIIAALHAGRAAASGFGLFQHGARATGQAGAFTARASEPSALTYNPAAITKLPGFQIQGGLDFNNAKNDYRSSSGAFVSKHIIDFPPNLYLTWKAKESPIALGLGFDSPFWYRVNWFPALFPNRFLGRQFELKVFELHPVFAWDLGEGWSVAAGLRYDYGNMDQGDNALITVTPTGQAPLRVETERHADADVDGTSWDAAIHYADPSWGWGAVLRAPMRLKGHGGVDFHFRDVPSPAVQTLLEQVLPDGDSRQSFEIPRELRSGIWVAPYPELRLEFDVAWESWSSIERTSLTTSGIGGQPITTIRDRNWKDTYNLRLGFEGNVTDAFVVYGGVSREPTPVPSNTLLPDFPRGDATVYGLGFSYNFPQISFDLAGSYHHHDSQRTGIDEPFNPGVKGSYSATDKVWAFSIRRRF